MSLRNITQLSEDLETAESNISELQAFVGYTDSDIYGVEVDFENKTFTRLAGAAGLEAGSDFDNINAFGGRKRCNLTNDGVVTAYYGDEGYSATGALTEAVTVDDVEYAAGTSVQVMVEQPKFYYKVVPLKTEIISAGNNKGYHLRKASYYVSDTPKAGFKLHPAFIENGNTNDYIYLSAFEGSLHHDTYIYDDSQVMDTSADMLCSIAGAIPISGVSQSLTRANARLLATNRGGDTGDGDGQGWELAYAATVSASQLLMLIEYASFNMQSCIGNGVVSKTDDGSTNMAEATGATDDLGNASGAVENDDGYVCVSYRGEENFWGNIWCWVDGINIYNGTSFASGDYGNVYVADHSFADGTGDSPYEDTGIHPCYGNGYIKAFGYSEDFDWLFIPTETGGNSALPVGDHFYNTSSGWSVARMGGYWVSGTNAGAFQAYYWSANTYNRVIGARLVYVPSKRDSE